MILAMSKQKNYECQGWRREVWTVRGKIVWLESPMISEFCEGKRLRQAGKQASGQAGRPPARAPLRPAAAVGRPARTRRG